VLVYHDGVERNVASWYVQYCKKTEFSAAKTVPCGHCGGRLTGVKVRQPSFRPTPPAAEKMVSANIACMALKLERAGVSSVIRCIRIGKRAREVIVANNSIVANDARQVHILYSPASCTTEVSAFVDSSALFSLAANNDIGQPWQR
jgi:hypothetical protein